MKLTQRFSVNTPPTIPGVYLTCRTGEGSENFWRAFDGKDWYYGILLATSPEAPDYKIALKKGIVRGSYVNFTWQGLAEQPVL
jgi:hypothetical protein